MVRAKNPRPDIVLEILLLLTLVVRENKISELRQLDFVSNLNQNIPGDESWVQNC